MEMTADTQLTNDQQVMELTKLLNQNNLKAAANNIFEMAAYVDAMEKKMDSVIQKLVSVKDQLHTMGVQGVDGMLQEEYRKAAVDAVKKLSQDVGIPADLKDIVKKEDIPFLAQSAYDDACRPGNPKETSVEDIIKLYESLI